MTSETRGGTAGLTATAMFNGFVGAHVVFALHELGVLERLAAGPVPFESLVRQSDATPARLGALLDAGQRLGHVRRDGDAVALTAAGAAVARERGYLTWLVGGSGEMFLRLADLTVGRSAYGVDVVRDDRQVAIGASQVDQAIMRPIEEEIVGGLPYTSVADVGCGSGGRLIRLCRRPGVTHGVGIEIAAGAAQLASKNIAEAGMGDRIAVVHADILECAATGQVFAGIELVTSFLMLHDLFNTVPDGGETMRTLRRTFPDARHFLIADTVRQPWEQLSGPAPIFSVGFELLHAYMDVSIHTLERYESAFAAAGLEIERREPFGAPSTWLYLLGTR